MITTVSGNLDERLRALVAEWEKFADNSSGMKLEDARKQGQYELLMAGQALAYATAAKQLRVALAALPEASPREAPGLKTLTQCQVFGCREEGSDRFQVNSDEVALLVILCVNHATKMGAL